jgi:hypothetical protein
MNPRAKTFGSPSGEPSTTRPMPQQNVRKTLDTTIACSTVHFLVRVFWERGVRVSEDLFEKVDSQNCG